MKIESPKVAAILKKTAKQCGGYAALGRKLGITRQAIYRWRQIPVEYVLTLEELTGAPAHTLRPDIYRKPRKRAA